MTVITAIIFFATAITFLANFIKSNSSKKDGNKAPGPKSWPLIGNLFYIGKFIDTTEAFTNLRREFGNMVSIKLGVWEAVVISGWKNYREVLIQNGHLFDARPAFDRYTILFGGSRNNSLAFGDGSETHHNQRTAIAHHTFMKQGTISWENFENATQESVFNFIEQLKPQVQADGKIDIKLQMASAIASSFLKFYCNMDLDQNDTLFKDMVSSFDSIFQEINEGHIGDVLPMFMRLWNKNQYIEHGHKIREFCEKIILPQSSRKVNEIPGQQLDENNNNGKEEPRENNLWNSLLDLIDNGEASYENVMFAFEDLVGGHSAVANCLVRMIHYIATNQDVQQKIREEVEQHASGFPNMSDRLTYTEAVIQESLRFISSPIVPHVCTEDTSIEDYQIKKGTIVMFNNYDMNMSSELWDQPEKFMPERFINEKGHIAKPEYFLPFSTGRRGCLGYKLFIFTAKVMIANLCQSFQIDVDPSTPYNNFPRGVIATGKGNSCPFVFKPLD